MTANERPKPGQYWRRRGSKTLVRVTSVGSGFNPMVDYEFQKIVRSGRQSLTAFVESFQKHRFSNEEGSI